MVNKNFNRPFDIIDKLFDGDGQVIRKELIDVKPINVKICNEVILNAGSGIGFHTHSNESEIYYIISGRGEYSDNGKLVNITAGDTTICSSGEGHSIKNIGEEALKFFAVIILE